MSLLTKGSTQPPSQLGHERRKTGDLVQQGVAPIPHPPSDNGSSYRYFGSFHSLARVAKLVDAQDLKSWVLSSGRAGSIPASGTIIFKFFNTLQGDLLT